MHSVKRARKVVDLPMRVRRRQSDARWRANVASCFETLKHVIPVNKRANKRQISKASILQETDRHIKCLEDFLTTLLQEKASLEGHPDAHQYCQEQWNAIRQEFVVKQRQKIVDQSSEKRSNRHKLKVYGPVPVSSAGNCQCIHGTPRMKRVTLPSSPARRIIPLHKTNSTSKLANQPKVMQNTHERKQAAPRKMKFKCIETELSDPEEVKQEVLVNKPKDAKNKPAPKEKKNNVIQGFMGSGDSQAKLPDCVKNGPVMSLKPSGHILKAALQFGAEKDILNGKHGVQLVCSEDKENIASVNVIMIPTSDGVWKGHVVPPCGRMLNHHDKSLLTRNKNSEKMETLDIHVKSKDLKNQVVPSRKRTTSEGEAQCVPEKPLEQAEPSSSYEQSYMCYLKSLEEQGLAEVPVLSAEKIKQEKDEEDPAWDPCPTPQETATVSCEPTNQILHPCSPGFLASSGKIIPKMEPISLIFRDLPLSPLAKLETPEKHGSQFPLTPSPTPHTKKADSGRHGFAATPSRFFTTKELTPIRVLTSSGLAPVTQTPYWQWDTPISPGSSSLNLTPFKREDDKWETSSLRCEEEMFNSDREEEDKPYRVKELHAKLKKVRRKRHDTDIVVTSDENCSEKKNESGFSNRTPEEKPSKVPRCRRSLNMDDIKCEPLSRPTTPVGNALEFDMYLNKFEEQIKTGKAECSLPRVSPTVHKIWHELVSHCQEQNSQTTREPSGLPNKVASQSKSSADHLGVLSEDLKNISVLPIKQETPIEGSEEDYIRMDQFTDGLDEFVTFSWDLNATDEIFYDSSQDDEAVSSPHDQDVPLVDLHIHDDIYPHQRVPELNLKSGQPQMRTIDDPLYGIPDLDPMLHPQNWNPSDVSLQEGDRTELFSQVPPLDDLSLFM